MNSDGPISDLRAGTGTVIQALDAHLIHALAAPGIGPDETAGAAEDVPLDPYGDLPDRAPKVTSAAARDVRLASAAATAGDP
jgi:hypothetical protein